MKAILNLNKVKTKSALIAKVKIQNGPVQQSAYLFAMNEQLNIETWARISRFADQYIWTSGRQKNLK